MYQLLIEKQVQKQLEKIPSPDYQRLKKAIKDLAIRNLREDRVTA